MPALTSLPYPNAVAVLMALLGDIAPVYMSPPNDFSPPLITVRRIGGQPNLDNDTDFPIMLVSCWGATYPAAKAISDLVQVRILSAGCTEVGGVLIDVTDVHVGEQEVPDMYPDDRRIDETYIFSWRRQFRP